MTQMTQGLLLSFAGAVLLRLAFSEAYLRYVTEWMKWPLVAAGALLLVVAAAAIFGRDPDDEPGAREAEAHPPPLASWLLFLPGLVVFTISPPELGSFLAERRAGQAVVAPPVSTPLPDRPAVRLPVGEFVGRAQYGGKTLAGRTVTLSGFVSHGRGRAWYVTRMAIGCCAADALALRVRVDGHPAPPRDTWIEARGTWVPDSGTDLGDVPALAAETVTETEKPRQTYE